jgi:hypothetical protein
MNRNNIDVANVEFTLFYKGVRYSVLYAMDVNCWYVNGGLYLKEPRLKQFLNVTRAKQVLLAWSGVRARTGDGIGPKDYVTKKKRRDTVRKFYQVAK